MASAAHCSFTLATSLQRSDAPSLQLRAARPLQRYLLPPLLTRRTPQQHGGLKPTASAADAADSDFPPFPKPPFKVARSPDWDERPAVVLPDRASGSASEAPATRRQLDQLFDTLSSKHNIRTAQCWSFSKYREFATPIYDDTSEAIGCCYFTVSALTVTSHVS